MSQSTYVGRGKIRLARLLAVIHLFSGWLVIAEVMPALMLKNKCPSFVSCRFAVSTVARKAIALCMLASW